MLLGKNKLDETCIEINNEITIMFCSNINNVKYIANKNLVKSIIKQTNKK